MEKDEFIAQLDRAVPGARPVSSLVLGYLSRELKKGDPPWWKLTQKAWEKRRFVSWNEAWSLFLTCLHFEALSSADNPLCPFFPSCGGTDEADPSGALAKFLAGAPGTFYDNLQTGDRRAFVPLRSLFWLAPGGALFQRRKLSYYLVELDAGAGLNLAADHFYPVKGFDPAYISARIGLDAKPLDPNDINQRRWLTAGLAPDNMKSIQELDRVVDEYIEIMKEDASFVQLAPCPADKAARFVAKNIPADDPEVGLLLMNMGVTCRMPDAEYAAFSRAVAETLAPWEDRAVWVEVEHVRGELYSTTYQVRAHRVVDGALRSVVLSTIELEAKKFTDHPEAQAFLNIPRAKAKRK